MIFCNQLYSPVLSILSAICGKMSIIWAAAHRTGKYKSCIWKVGNSVWTAKLCFKHLMQIQFNSDGQVPPLPPHSPRGKMGFYPSLCLRGGQKGGALGRHLFLPLALPLLSLTPGAKWSNSFHLSHYTKLPFCM